MWMECDKRNYVTATFSLQLKTAQRSLIILCEFVTSNFVSHLQEVWTRLTSVNTQSLLRGSKTIERLGDVNGPSRRRGPLTTSSHRPWSLPHSEDSVITLLFPLLNTFKEKQTSKKASAFVIFLLSLFFFIRFIHAWHPMSYKVTDCGVNWRGQKSPKLLSTATCIWHVKT